MKTKTAITLPWRNYGEITIPAGTRVKPVTPFPTQDRPLYWVDQFEWIEAATGFKDSMLRHDAVHYGITLEADQVEL